MVTEETIRKTNGPATEHPSGKRDGSLYQLLPEQAGSGVLDFLSSKFDPSAVLTRASVSDVSRANPWMEGSSILDNIAKCVNLLPDDDPLYQEDYLRRQLQKEIASKHSSATIQSLLAPQESSSKSNDDQGTKKRPHSNPHPFDTISSQLHSGPHSFLFRMKEERKRVRIVVRYVNMVRGNLSGTLIAFDKHMNIILRDVEEVYSPRLVDEENNKSNLELELERRRRVNTSREEAILLDDSSSVFDKGGQHLSQQPGMWNARKRQMKQLMVRGDMVVSIYEADKEDREIKKSRYYKQEAKATRNNLINNTHIAKRQKGNQENKFPSV